MTKNKKHIYIAYTGGTIGMHKTPTGYAPKTGFFSQALANMSEFQHPDMPHYTIHEYEPLLDSADMTPTVWNSIAQDIQQNFDRYDGFVILHGTDTMAYTASALSFILTNLSKPVILTGSQVPLIEVHTDARENLLCALLIAANYTIPEVCIYFNKKLFRGNRTRKLHAQKVNAFASPNFPLLGQVETEIKIYSRRLLQQSKDKFQAQKAPPLNISHLTFFPGISVETLEQTLQLPLQVLILFTYGTGNISLHDKRSLSCLEKAHSKGMILVNSSQCLTGTVDMGSYTAGQSLLNSGVISAFDMTPETILCKLYYLFGQFEDVSEIKKQFQNNLRGELTPSPCIDL